MSFIWGNEKELFFYLFWCLIVKIKFKKSNLLHDNCYWYVGIVTLFVMRPSGQPMANGLVVPRNGLRPLLSAPQAHDIKKLVFNSKLIAKDNKCCRQLFPHEHFRNKRA